MLRSLGNCHISNPLYLALLPDEGEYGERIFQIVHLSQTDLQETFIIVEISKFILKI